MSAPVAREQMCYLECFGKSPKTDIGSERAASLCDCVTCAKELAKSSRPTLPDLRLPANTHWSDATICQPVYNLHAYLKESWSLM